MDPYSPEIVAGWDGKHQFSTSNNIITRVGAQLIPFDLIEWAKRDRLDRLRDLSFGMTY
jgi:hypothetical protein